MRKNYRYIFWDFDGTIMNTYEGIARSLSYAFRFFGIPQQSEAELRTFIGPPLRESIPAHFPLDAVQTEVAVEKYRECYDDGGMFLCTPYPGVRELLSECRKNGYLQVITSSKPEVMCRAILKHFHMTEDFDEIVGASLDGRIDSKQQVLEEAFSRLGITDRSEALLIGDTRYDAQGARRCGISCAGVSWGFGTEQELKANGAITVFDTAQSAGRFLNEP